MNEQFVIRTLASYFMSEIKNSITVNNNELIVELADNRKVKITAKI